MASKIQVVNQALRLIGAERITTSNLSAEDNEVSKIINDVYDYLQDEILAEHPWNFAIKRSGSLTLLGGTITGWTAEGTANVWQASLTTEPGRVEFDGVEGSEKTSIATLTTEKDWWWDSNVLYVYSSSDPDTAFTTVNAIIPEFEWGYAFSLPADCLRIIHAKDDVDFVKEGNRLFTNESTIKIKYIYQVTDTTLYSPAFVNAFAARIAKEIAYPVTNDAKIVTAVNDLYKEKLRIAKAMDAQEGLGQREEEIEWQTIRG